MRIPTANHKKNQDHMSSSPPDLLLVTPTLSDLKPLELPSRPPKTLRLNKIIPLPHIFQCRETLEPDSKHVEDLMINLKEGIALEPIDVWKTEQGNIVLNGHHRLEAYKKVSWTAPVPVKFFKGDGESAYCHAIEGNSKAVVPLNKEEKTNGAWRLTLKHPDMSKDRVFKTTTIPTSTIANMRRVKRCLIEMGLNPHDYSTWVAARLAAKGMERTDYDDERLDHEAEKWSKKLAKALTSKPHKNPQLFARALDYYLGDKWGEVLQSMNDLKPLNHEDDIGY